MALKDLSLEAMISVSARILNPPANRPQINNKDELYSGLLVLKRAHDNLVSLNRQEGELRELSAQYSEELAELDREHDRCARAIFRTLETAADISTDPQFITEIHAALTTLFPTGLAINRLSYIEQAGNALRVTERVTPALRLLLSTIPIVNHTLDTILDRWLLAGKTLGILQAERDTLHIDHDPNRVTAALIIDGRNQWIRATHAFTSALDSTDYTEPEKTSILAHLRATEQQAANRKKPATKPATESAGDDTPAVADGEELTDV